MAMSDTHETKHNDRWLILTAGIFLGLMAWLFTGLWISVTADYEPTKTVECVEIPGKDKCKLPLPYTIDGQ